MARLAPFLLLTALLGGGIALAAATGPIESAERQAAEAAARAGRLGAEAGQARDEAGRLRASAAAMAARIEASEAEISAAEARLRLTRALQARQRARLEEKREPLLRLAAGLQSMARRPPALSVAQPGSVENYARLRAVLGSTVAIVEARTVELRADIVRSNRLAAEAARTATRLERARADLQARRLEFARLEKAALDHSRSLARSALTESDRSIAFTEGARRLEREAQSAGFAARVEADLAALPPPPAGPWQAEPPSFAYDLPVEGRVVTGTGELSEAGVHSRGITLATAPGAVVTAPRTGTVAYAGRFRSYGEIVIIDHGGGWSSTLLHMAALRVRPGDKVETGTPIGRTVSVDPRLTVELRKDGRPQAIAPFL